MISVKFDFPDLAAIIRRHEKELRVFVAAQIQTNRGLLFDHEGAYNGHPKWAPLKFRQGQILKDSGALSQSIGPKNATGSAGVGGIVRFEGKYVIVGSDLAYAWLMNWGTTKLPGGKLVPTSAKALMIPLPPGAPSKGGKYSASPKRQFTKEAAYVGVTEGKKLKVGATYRNVIFRKSVKIPARRFDVWNDADAEEVSIALRNRMEEILNAEN